MRTQSSITAAVCSLSLEKSSMGLLRWLVLGCLALALAGCGKKGDSQSGEVNSSFGNATDTYEWKRPSADLPQPTKTEKTDPF